MSTPEPNSAPEGQENTDTDDEAAQQALAALAAQEAGGDDDGDEDDDKFDESKARKRIEKVTREAKNLRDRIRQLEPLAKEAEQRRKEGQTEAQRLAEEKAALEVELAELRTANIRREAASTAGLPAEFVEFITGAEPEEALAQAKKLAKAMKAADSPSQRPDFRQGARGTSNSGSSMTQDDLIRQMARQR